VQCENLGVMGGRPMMRWGMMPLGLDGVRISFLNIICVVSNVNSCVNLSTLWTSSQSIQ